MKTDASSLLGALAGDTGEAPPEPVWDNVTTASPHTVLPRAQIQAWAREGEGWHRRRPMTPDT